MSRPIHAASSGSSVREEDSTPLLRPVALPPELVGSRAPCDIMNARGTILVKAGTVVPLLAGDPGRSAHYFCRAGEAERISLADPFRQLATLGRSLSLVGERVRRGEHVSTGDLLGLSRQLIESWRLDADACLGFARLAQFARPSVCHTVHAALLAAELAAVQGFTGHDLESVVGGALTMNLAGLSLHDEMFSVRGAPDPATRRDIRRHPLESVRLLEHIGKFHGAWVDAVGLHHENIDGTGYPLRLKGMDIALSARMLRIADTLAARLTGRKNRPPRHWNISQTRETHQLVQHVFGFDLRRLDLPLVRQLMSALGHFPPGSLVRLNNREVAVVARRAPGSERKPPLVFTVFDPLGQALETPRARKVGFGQVDIRSYAHDELARLPPYDWRKVWGYAA